MDKELGYLLSSKTRSVFFNMTGDSTTISFKTHFCFNVIGTPSRKSCIIDRTYRIPCWWKETRFSLSRLGSAAITDQYMRHYLWLYTISKKMLSSKNFAKKVFEIIPRIRQISDEPTLSSHDISGRRRQTGSPIGRLRPTNLKNSPSRSLCRVSTFPILPVHNKLKL